MSLKETIQICQKISVFQNIINTHCIVWVYIITLCFQMGALAILVLPSSNIEENKNEFFLFLLYLYLSLSLYLLLFYVSHPIPCRFLITQMKPYSCLFGYFYLIHSYLIFFTCKVRIIIESTLKIHVRIKNAYPCTCKALRVVRVHSNLLINVSYSYTSIFSILKYFSLNIFKYMEKLKEFYSESLLWNIKIFDAFQSKFQISIHFPLNILSCKWL